MKNMKKYKTAEERVDAFFKIYKDFKGSNPFKGIMMEFSDWLDADRTLGSILPCPFCGEQMIPRTMPSGSIALVCSNDICMYRCASMSTLKDAIAAHNNFASEKIKEAFRIGWDIPTDPDDLDDLGNDMHKHWRKAVKSGMVPNEDVSPGEPFVYFAKAIRDRQRLNDALTHIDSLVRSRAPNKTLSRQIHKSVLDALKG